MTEAEYEKLAEEIQRLVKDHVDEHAIFSDFPEVERYNMSYSAGCAAMSALSPEYVIDQHR